MNYDKAFENFGKAVSASDPRDLGKAPDSQPRSIEIPSETLTFTARLRNGTIAGRVSLNILDNKDHFPVLTETQARSSLARSMQLREVPVWYKGTVAEMRREVYEGILEFHPNLTDLRIQVSAEQAMALSDGQTKKLVTKKIKDPADVVENMVPGVKRPNITSAEFIVACEDTEVLSAFAGKLMDLINKQEEELIRAKDLAQGLTKKGLKADQFNLLSSYLQQDILRDLMYNSVNAANMDTIRRNELLNRLQEEDK